jgi:outer membrane protein assembly factor BamB
MMLLKRPLPLLKTLCLCVLFSALPAFALPAHAHAQPGTSPNQQPPGAQQVAAPLKLRWPARPRTRRYRLQVALDQKFNDIVFDRAVEGLEQEVSGLQPGKYYWRVAPATPETGRYSAPALVEAALPVAVVPVAAAVIRPPADVGWQAAIGTVARPFAARLRAGKNPDLVALNSDGAIYALDSADGTPLWLARERRSAPTADATKEKPRANPFTPLVLPATAESRSIVAVAFGEGIRGLDGETGRELWRDVMQGRLLGGTLAQMQGGDNTATADFAIATSDPDMLYVLEGRTGRIVSKTKLSGAVIGSPIPFTHGDVNGVAVALENRQLEIRKRDGSVVRAIKFDVSFTTPPLVLATPRGTLVIIGTDHGLLFFEGADLKPLGRITTEQDAPRGRLTAADLNGDDTIEIVMVTKNGRVAVISTAGKINWASEGATDAYMATFAHLNTDGVLDVVVASSASFALGFSGQDGSLIWRADENAKTPSPQSVEAEEKMLRTLTGAISSTGVPLLVGGDAARSSVRAIGLPAPANKAAVK